MARWWHDQDQTIFVERDRFELLFVRAQFDRNTLLTSSVVGGTSYHSHDSAGFLLADLTYRATKSVTATANNYSFYDIANLLYADVRDSLAPA